MIKIEKNIPIPPPKPSKYPFEQLEVDDSFVVPVEQLNSARAAMYSEHRKNNGKRFLSRMEGETARFWRTK